MRAALFLLAFLSALSVASECAEWMAYEASYGDWERIALGAPLMLPTDDDWVRIHGRKVALFVAGTKRTFTGVVEQVPSFGGSVNWKLRGDDGVVAEFVHPLQLAALRMEPPAKRREFDAKYAAWESVSLDRGIPLAPDTLYGRTVAIFLEGRGEMPDEMVEGVVEAIPGQQGFVWTLRPEGGPEIVIDQWIRVRAVRVR